VTLIVLYVMLWPTEPMKVVRIPMGAATCEAVLRQHEHSGRWPATECMPGNWKVGEPLPWETRYRRGVCPDDTEKCT
jgi:hypothetical protein